MIGCREIDEYIEQVRRGDYPVCREQFLLCDMLERIFANEDLRVDGEQLAAYLDLQKYFPYRLYPWEKFCFALHNCVYDKDGNLRFPILVIFGGRGLGKNGYLSFEDFCLLTPVNGVMHYDIDIFAMSEDQAKASWQDVYEVLETNKTKMQRFFRWTKEEIVNIKTRSTFRFRTSAYKSKDGGRPGKVDFDEYHAYESTKLIGVAVTGLGKVAHPRRTIITTNGNVRGLVLDKSLERWEEILAGEKDDNGTLPFVCRLDEDEEIENPEMWYKANPSLQYKPDLLHELKLEFSDYLEDPITYSDFATKRMNRPPKETEGCVTSWENILKTNQEIPDNVIFGKPCVAGFDYTKTNDMLSAGLLYHVEDKYYWVTHSWICKRSKDLPKIKAPLEAWAAKGLLTFVDAPEIPPETAVMWVMTEAARRNSVILKIGIDNYRYTLLSKALRDYFFSPDKETNANIKLIRPSDEMKVIPAVTSGFINGKFCFGDNELMRWAVNNSKEEKVGVNIIYGKIEPSGRKTDPFKAFVQAFIVADVLDKPALGYLDDIDLLSVITI
ncbi:MAG: terminase large subunit [Clostridiales bacterium]|nr:terminase large subunit [Clostridiales bacterium]